MELAIRLLGTLEADVDDAAADLGEPPSRASAALQVYISNLRRALEPARAPRSAARYLVTAPPGYAVRFDEPAVDAWHFERSPGRWDSSHCCSIAPTTRTGISRRRAMSRGGPDRSRGSTRSSRTRRLCA
jgi:hypothetical protein